MEPLIEITTVPIEIQMKVTDAQLEYHRGIAQMEIRRDKGGLQIQSQPIKVRMDTFEARSSITPTTIQSIQQQAQRGKQGAYHATAVLAQQGRMMMEAKMDQNVIGEIARQETMPEMKQVSLDFLPSTGPNISWEGGDISIRYEMDKLNFDWRIQKNSFTFIPGDIEFTMTQRPDVIVKYVGGPIYVPPSSDPEYEPLDVSV